MVDVIGHVVQPAQKIDRTVLQIRALLSRAFSATRLFIFVPRAPPSLHPAAAGLS
jgi:hypothetical protein